MFQMVLGEVELKAGVAIIGVSARGARGAPAPPERKSSRLRGKASEETCPLFLTLLNSYLFGFEMYVMQSVCRVNRLIDARVLCSS